MMRILVTGSRDWNDGDLIDEALLHVWLEHDRPSEVTVVTGACRGADSITEAIARRQGFDVELHPAQWLAHGKAAGPIRNRQMVELGADVCLAFIKNGSRGATHCADTAEKAGIPTRRVVAS